MKKLTLFSGVLALAATTATAQVTENFNHGARSTSQANCWQTPGTDVKSDKSYSINTGAEKPMLQTGQLTGGAANPNRLISPFVDFDGSGTVTFKHRLSANNGTERDLEVLLLDTAGNVSQTLLAYNYRTSNVNSNGNSTIAQAESITVSWSGVFQIEWKWVGTGGNSRGVIDDVSISGTYAADPSRNNGGNCALLKSFVDSDGDGVNDDVDEFPNDPNKVCIAYLLGKDKFYTVAYEDLWPAYGDFDFNDLVLDANWEGHLDTNHKIVETITKIHVRAIGAGFNNGLGLSFPSLAPADVQSVSGTQLTSNYVSLSANGTEAGQSTAVVIPFDEAGSMVQRAQGPFHNTRAGDAAGTGDTLEMRIVFAQPVEMYNSLPIDFFLIKDGQRGDEIHLPYFAPTDLADASKFGTVQDDTDVSESKFYKSDKNFPWALIFGSRFDYPTEKTDIVEAYSFFDVWAQSGGSQRTDWYKDLAGYRTAAKIY